jgi:hypothetical protein
MGFNGENVMVWEFIGDCCKYGLKGFPDELINSPFQPIGEKILEDIEFEFFGLNDSDYWLRLGMKEGLNRYKMRTESSKGFMGVGTEDREITVISLHKENMGVGSYEDFERIGSYAAQRLNFIAKEMLSEMLEPVTRTGDDREWRATEEGNKSEIMLWDQRQKQINSVFFNMFYRTLKSRDDFQNSDAESLAKKVLASLQQYEYFNILEMFKEYIPKGSEHGWVDFG